MQKWPSGWGSGCGFVKAGMLFGLWLANFFTGIRKQRLQGADCIESSRDAYGAPTHIRML